MALGIPTGWAGLPGELEMLPALFRLHLSLHQAQNPAPPNRGPCAPSASLGLWGLQEWWRAGWARVKEKACSSPEPGG